MKYRGRIDQEGAVELPEEKQRGSYPPHVLELRRKYRLPITPEEHAAYDRGHYREPPVTNEQMEATLRRVLPRCSPVFAAVLREIAARVRAKNREPGEEG